MNSLKANVVAPNHSNKLKELRFESKYGLNCCNTNIVALFLKNIQSIVLSFFIFFLGFFRFSISWMFLTLILYLWHERSRMMRKIKADLIRDLESDEKKAVFARIDDLPSWVYFPDKERAEWANQIIKKIWPYFGSYMKTVFKESIEPITQASVPLAFGKIRFEMINFGDIPPRIGSIKVYAEHTIQNEIVIDVEFLYSGNAEFKIENRKMLFGVQNIQCHGDLRIILKPLCDKIPLFGAITVYFLRTPSFDFSLTDIINVLDLPIMNECIKMAIADVLEKSLVLPNRLVIPMFSNPELIDMNSLRKPHPKGVLRVYVFKAFNLIRSDINIFGQTKSDPYVKIHGCGNPEFKTKVIQNNLNPEWNEVFHLIIEDLIGNYNLYFDVYDEDISEDDHIGGLTIDVQQIITKGFEEGIYNLKNVKRGQIMLKFEWFYLTDNINDLIKPKKYPPNSLTFTLPMSMLIVHLKHANGLQVIKKSNGIYEPNPFAILTVGNKTFTSSIQMNTTNPHWDENFFFLVENSEHEILSLRIHDKKTDEKLCSLNFSISELLVEDNLTLNQQFYLKGSNDYAKITMALSLKIFSAFPPNADYKNSTSPIIETKFNKNLLPSTLIQEGSLLNTKSKLQMSQLKRNISESNQLNKSKRSSSQQSISSDSKPQPKFNQSTSSILSPSYTSFSSEGECEGLRMQSITRSSSVTFHPNIGHGKINMTLQYDVQKNLFLVTIHSCKSLKPVHSTNLPKPFIILSLSPESKIKHKTKILRDTLDPILEETFEWPITLKELKRKSLEIQIKNDKPIFSTEKVHMGQLALDLDKIDLNQPFNDWFDICGKK